jgi:hypothetical protein
MSDNNDDQEWATVIGRSLAFLALNGSGLREKDLATQGEFLEALGLPRKEAAALLRTTPASLTELYRRARTKKKGKHGKSKAKG